LGDKVSEVKYFPKSYPSNVSVRIRHLRYELDAPVYPWEDLQLDDYKRMVRAITKTTIYGKYQEDLVQDHSMWREGRVGLEALRFMIDLCTVREFKRGVRNFNRQVGWLKYSNTWLDPLYGGGESHLDALAQLGQWIYNLTRFLIQNDYLVVHYHPKLYGVTLVRPYPINPYDATLEKMWLEQFMLFASQYKVEQGRFPSLGDIADHFGVSKRLLAECGFTYEFLRNAFKTYRLEGEIESLEELRLEKPYKPITKDQLRKWAKKVLQDMV